MVDEDGYPKIIDFGSAKIIETRTYTILGTPHYLAPEVLLGKGYGHNVDLWSLGIILYEFVWGKVPFGEELTDTYQIYEAILSEKLNYPAFARNRLISRPLIEQLLNRNPAARGTAATCRKSQWFRGFDWDNLIIRNLKPNYQARQERFDLRIKAKGEEIDEIIASEELDIQESSLNFTMAPEGWDVDF